MGASIVKLPDEATMSHLTNYFHDNHNNYVSADVWTAVTTDSGAVTRPDQAGGGLKLETSDATVGDNDQVWIKTTAEMYLLANEKPLYSKSLIQYTEAATDDANIWVGFMDAIAADALVDDGAGPKTSGSHIGVFKVDGGTVWKFHTSLGATQTTTTSTTTAGGTAKQLIEIFAYSVTSTTIDCFAKVDGQHLRDTNGDPIVHTITLGSPTEMNFGYGVKAGSATEQTMFVYDTVVAQTY